MNFNRITPVIVNEAYFEKAMKSKSSFVIFEMGDFISLKERVEQLKIVGKEVFVKINEIEGLKEEDDATMVFLKSIGVIGVTSNKTKVLAKAKKVGLKTVYTAFIFDTKSFGTTLKNIKISKPDIIEIRPGLMTKVIKIIKAENENIPIWSTGLITEEYEIQEALKCGAQTVVTSKIELW
ncbi:MAG: glycerol-3-phosphate responsive antiterminator [Fusobacteriaceae bacterium]